MFSTNYIKNNKIIGIGKPFSTLEEAEDNIAESEFYDSTKANYYEIINSITDEVEEEGEIPDNDEDGGMFPDEDSKEGFDY